MADPVAVLSFVSLATIGVGMASGAALRGWNGWLEIRRMELERRAGAAPGLGGSELSELRRRVRRLEAIAEGAPGAG